MIVRLSNAIDIQKAFEQVGVDSAGSVIMAKKAKLNLFKIKKMSVKAANILKQDALSIGAELATSRQAANFSSDYTDAILICNNKQLEILSKKELSQPFGLKNIAVAMSSHIHYKQHKKEIMGVLNVNFDSFFADSRVGGSDFLDRANLMMAEGADIIDIGGVSSRPGSSYPGEEAEVARLQPIFELIKSNKLYEKVKFSVDTFSPVVAKMAFESGFCILNDITGLKNDELAKIAGQYQVFVVIMHKKGSTESMQHSPHYDDVVGEIDTFFQDRIEKAIAYNVQNIILDVGIGFGKNLDHNIALLQALSHFEHFGFPLLIGASRKRMIDEIVPTTIENRLAGSLCIHQAALNNGASIIRVHDVKEHVQMLRIHEKMQEFV